MTRCFIIISVFTQLLLRSQSASDNDSLLLYEMRFYNSTDQTTRALALVSKVNHLLRTGDTTKKVIQEIRRVNISHLESGESKTNYLWNASLCAYIHNETDLASFLFSEYQNTASDTTVQACVMNLLVNGKNDSVSYRNKLNMLIGRDTSLQALTCVFDADNYERKKRKLYLALSAIAPGSGMIAQGYVVRGLLAMSIAAGSVYGIVTLVQHGLYINAVLWGTGVGLKFYTGNINLTDKLFHMSESKQKKKLADNCELQLEKIFQKYPLTLKGL